MRLIITLLCLSFSFVVSGTLFAQEDFSEVPVQETIDLQLCSDSALEIQFLCNPDWELESEGDTLFIIISYDPAVTMTLAKSDSPVILLNQLTENYIKEMGQYADGFKVSEVNLGGLSALQVDGFPDDYPEARLLDYYIIHGFHLYSILFSVDPKEAWQGYEGLFFKIAGSFVFNDK